MSLTVMSCGVIFITPLRTNCSFIIKFNLSPLGQTEAHQWKGLKSLHFCMCNVLSLTLTNRHLQMLRELHGLEILHSVVQSTSVSWCLEWAFYMYNSLKEHKHSPSLIIYILYKQPLVTTTTTTSKSFVGRNMPSSFFTNIHMCTKVWNSLKTTLNLAWAIAVKKFQLLGCWCEGPLFYSAAFTESQSTISCASLVLVEKKLLSISVKCNTVKSHV